MKNFDKIKLEHKAFFKDILINNNVEISEFNFINLFVWGEFYDFEWTDYEGRILIYNNYDNIIYMPQGKPLKVKQLLEISDYFKKENKSGDFTFAGNPWVKENSREVSKYFEIKEEPAYFDYVYLTEKLVKLKGKKLNKKKNLISQFKRKNENYEVKKLTSEDSQEAVKLSKKWCKTKFSDDRGIDIEMEALKNIFNNFNNISAEALGIFINDNLEAFAVFSPLNKETYDVHFEKYNVKFKGIAQYINNQTAEYLKDKCVYINRESDMGIAGLKKNKRSWAPEKMIKTYSLIRKEELI
ncbi:MAG: DUF2156 domain-containing protein [Candidatus Muiribacteriota bacterium]